MVALPGRPLIEALSSSRTMFLYQYNLEDAFLSGLFATLSHLLENEASLMVPALLDRNRNAFHTIHSSSVGVVRRVEELRGSAREPTVMQPDRYGSCWTNATT